MEDLAITKQAGPVTMRKGATGQEVQVGDSLSVAAVAQERAQIETAAMLAQMKPPRDLDSFRTKLLLTVEDPSIAELWFYSRPAGRRKNPKSGEWEEVIVTGPSIRAGEISIQQFGKAHISSRHIYEDRERVLLAATVYDLETITVFSSDVMVEKTVERKQPRIGQNVIRARENSRGETVYLVEASADEVKTRVAAERSKLIRDNILRLIPRGILDEVGERVKDVLANEHAKDPNAARKKIFDRFASIGITPEMLKEYIALDTLTAKDIAELTFIHNGLKQGDFTWSDLIAANKTLETEPDAPADPKATKLKEKILDARSKAKSKEKAEAPPPAEETPKEA